jgi:uncharacterized membrane protein
MEARRLPARQGWEWIKQGYALFMQAPILWVVLLIVCFLAAIGLSLIPIIGEPLVTLLTPMVVVGLMAGCRELKRGEPLELAHLFSGFQHHTSQLITLGGITLVGQYLIFGLMILVGGAELVAILMSGQPPEDPEIIAQTIAGAGFSVLLGLVLFSVLMMAMQFAPMLVYFNNLSPITAMQSGLHAFTRNIGAFFVYFFTLTLLALLASMPAMLGWLILLPIIFTSLYAAYLDIFPLVVETSDTPSESLSAQEDEIT